MSLFWYTELLHNIKRVISITSSAVAVVLAWSKNVGAFENELFGKIFFGFSLDHHESFIKSNSCESPTGATASLVLNATGLGSPVWRSADFEAGLDGWDGRAGGSRAQRSFGTEEFCMINLKLLLFYSSRKSENWLTA